MVQQRNRAAVCASWCWLRDIEEQAVSRIECSEREEECLRGEGQSWKRKGEDAFALSLSLSFTFPLPFVSFPFPSPSLPSFPFPFPSLLTLVSFHAHPTDVFSSIHISNEKKSLVFAKRAKESWLFITFEQSVSFLWISFRSIRAALQPSHLYVSQESQPDLLCSHWFLTFSFYLNNSYLFF